MTKHISHFRAMAYALAGHTIWVLGDTCTKLAGQMRMPPVQIIVLCSLFAILTIGVVTVARGRARFLKPVRVKLEFGRGLMWSVQSFTNVISFTVFPLATVYTLLFTVPLLSSLGAAFSLREPLSLRNGLAILAGFGGVLLAVGPEKFDLGDHSWTHCAVLFAFPLLAAVNTVWVRFMSRTESSESMALFPMLVRTVVLLPFCLWYFEPLTAEGLLAVMGLGFFGGVGFLFVMAAYKHAPVALIVPFQYTQLIIGAIVGYLIWSDVPSWNLLGGAAVITASGLYIVHRARQTAVKTVAVSYEP